ncbi:MULTISPECIES: RNA 2',3'-cyclic phosphodiesterase [unclassified Sutcliffiella]|jgi:RNA 2',3'-cyclic 3'-phosphodiesterase|uniref:RNA 2',3'-cyclic phosphodiesterase n=1 Tax=unclassified Sutcliffiella TaxID=2837532 RepID=UPI0030CC6F09
MTTQTHYFIAVPLPKEWKEELHLYMKELKGKYPFTRWVHPEDLHLTLAFLGNMEESQKEKLVSLTLDVAAQHRSFSLTLSELGTFGNPQSPRIFWLGVENSPSLNSLRKDIYAACEKVGFQLDSRPFHPHITLARKWKGPGSIDQESLLTNSEKGGSYEVKEIVLYETHLNRMPKYEEKEIFPLV